MVQVSYPGVYIEEVPSGVRTITEVSTSIAAFFGRASQGPINKAVRVLSLADYQRTFGQPHPKSDLAQSVRQFFANGGTDCYVIRLAEGATPAKVTLENLNGDQVLAATAKAEGTWANTVRLEVDYNTANPDETFNLRVLQEEGGTVIKNEAFSGLSMDPNSPRYAPSFVTQSSDLIKLESAVATTATSFDGFSQGRRPLGPTKASGANIQSKLNSLIKASQSKFEISVNESQYVSVDIAISPPIPASIATGSGGIQYNIQEKVNDQLKTVSSEAVLCTLDTVTGVGRLLRFTAGSSAANVSVRVRRSPSDDIATALMLGVDQGGIEAVRFSDHRPAPTATLLPIEDPSSPGSLDTVNELAALQQKVIKEITITATTTPVEVALNAPPCDLKTTQPTTTVPNPQWFQNKSGDSSVTEDQDGVREKLKIIAKAINNESKLTYKAEVWGYQLALIETKGTVNAQPASVETTNKPFDTALKTNVRQYTLGAGGSGSFSVNGTDGTNGGKPNAGTYKGNETDQTGFHALDAVDLFNLVVLPGDEEFDLNDLWSPASNYCKKHRAFLLIDPPSQWTKPDSKTGENRPEVKQDTGLINTLRQTLVKDHSAVFYPRLKYKQNKLVKTIGPAGAIAGLMARTDANRGVWKAPAGIEAGIREIVGLDVELTDAENGVLNKKGVNCLRVFPNGIVNWGARTLDGDDDSGSEWKYIPIRRLALMLEESLYRGTRWVVFEPNDEPLWANIRLNVGAFMMSLFRRGAFQGTSPKEAFYVKCDKDTTTQDDRNKGIVNIDVGFAPLKPAEFVVIKIQQMAGEL